MDSWILTLARRHLAAKQARAALRWMNVFAALALCLGVFAWIAVTSVMGGLQADTRGRILDEKPHLLWEGTPRAGLREKGAELESLLEGRLKRVRSLLQTEGLLEAPRSDGGVKASGVVIQGVDEIEHEGFVLGGQLASQLTVFTGDELRLRSAWALDKEPLEGAVVDLFNSGIYDVDRGTLRVARHRLASWLGMSDDVVSRIEIQLHDPTEAEAWAERVSSVLGVPVSSWEVNEASLWYSLKVEKWLMSLVVFFTIILASFAVYMALAVRVTEKLREIGLLRALGAPEHKIVFLYLLEGGLLGLFSSMLGLFLAWIFCMVLTNWMRLPDFYYSLSIPVEWNPWRAWGLVGVVTLLSLLASWLPARKGVEQPIADSLRS
jgi:lipoprotein-releasing system permease protein